jgi:choline dehydrogenase-like flavoprotein
MNPPLVHYAVGRKDAASMARSTCSSLRVLAAAGATYVCTLHAGPYGLERYLPKGSGQGSDEAAKAAKAREVDALCDQVAATGLPLHGVGLFSAHQMGSCRMGSDPLASVVDEDGGAR